MSGQIRQNIRPLRNDGAPPEYCTVQECRALRQLVNELASDNQQLIDMFKAEQKRTDRILQEIINYASLSPEQRRGNVIVPKVPGRMLGGASKRRTLKSKRR